MSETRLEINVLLYLHTLWMPSNILNLIIKIAAVERIQRHDKKPHGMEINIDRKTKVFRKKFPK